MDDSAAAPAALASYDAVGKYRQDDVNGFDEALLERFLDLAKLDGAGQVLDAMAGDGNLTLRMHGYCRRRGIPFPRTTLLEYSRVQCGLAGRSLRDLPARVVWGDILTMSPRGAGAAIPPESFDRILLKSGNHEIPRERQDELYASLFRALKPGGVLVNLGLAFESDEERDELREIARVKDGQAGMEDAARNRHFLTRAELHERLARAGFEGVEAAESIDYVIRSEVVAEQYFEPARRRMADAEHQAAMARAFALRRSGRIRFEGERSVMRLPGEITIARRPSLAEGNRRTFRQYPMDFLRKVEVHAELLRRVARRVPDGARVLDLGCGLGLLAEHLGGRRIDYTGIDVSPEFVAAATERFADRPGFRFAGADLNAASWEPGSADVVAILNTLNMPGLDALRVLEAAHRALRPEGRIWISGPTSARSFADVEPRLLAQFERDGLLESHREEIAALRAANARLLTDRANYWSAEGLAALLRHLGWSRIVAAETDLYHGHAYLVGAEK